MQVQDVVKIPGSALSNTFDHVFPRMLSCGLQSHGPLTSKLQSRSEHEELKSSRLIQMHLQNHGHEESQAASKRLGEQAMASKQWQTGSWASMQSILFV